MVGRVKGDSQFVKGRRGLAELVRLDANRVRVDFEKTDKEKEESFNINVSFGEDGTIPEYVPVKKMKDNAKIRVSATMNEDGSALLFASPASGEFDAKLDKFVVKKEGDAPVPETKKGKKGKDYQVFAVLLQITTGPWKGANLWYQMYPNFGADEDGNLAVRGEGSGSDALYDFMEATGVVEHTIPFSENPLPDIQKLALEENREFRIIVAKGWIDRIIAPLGEEDAFVGDEQDADKDFPVKEEAPAPVVTHSALED